jgi:hypothetical protein
MAWVQCYEYIVEPCGTEWTVTSRGQHYGHFPSRHAALRAAVGGAHRVRHLGHAVRVLVRCRGGRHLRELSAGQTRH